MAPFSQVGEQEALRRSRVAAAALADAL